MIGAIVISIFITADDGDGFGRCEKGDAPYICNGEKYHEEIKDGRFRLDAGHCSRRKETKGTYEAKLHDGDCILPTDRATVVEQTRFACGYGQRLEDLIVDPQCDWKGSQGELAVGLHQSAHLGSARAMRIDLKMCRAARMAIAYASLAEALSLVNSSENCRSRSGTGLTLMAAVIGRMEVTPGGHWRRAVQALHASCPPRWCPSSWGKKECAGWPPSAVICSTFHWARSPPCTFHRCAFQSLYFTASHNTCPITYIQVQRCYRFAVSPMLVRRGCSTSAAPS